MDIFTSYYSKAKTLDTEQYALFRVSITMPGWFDKQIYALPDIYPKWSILDAYKRNVISEKEYIAKYLQQLAMCDKNEIRRTIEKLTGERAPVLLCWESSDKFCHRRILASWLGYTPKEL